MQITTQVSGRRHCCQIIVGLLAFLVLVPHIGAAAAPRQFEPIAGLDSLASATLQRALDYLEVRPDELGFDKLYAEDDTFRLGLVEDLLNHPLRLPGWQSVTVDRVRHCIDDPAALARFLGEVCEAPDASVPPPAPTRGSWLRLNDSFRAEAAPVEGQGEIARQAVETFVRRCREAEQGLEKAFAGLSENDKAAILVLAPAFWGDWEEPGSTDKARKGMIHFEVGATADTTIKLTEHPILDAAVKLDRAALTHAASRFLAALIDLSANLSTIGFPAMEHTIEGVTGTVSSVYETPWGQLVIGGRGDNVYSPSALARIAFLIEPGGDDLYRGRAASAVGGLIRPFSAIVDGGGDDLYDGSGRPNALGGAVLGVAALIDLRGNDVYRGDDGSLGAGFFGAGLLYDGGGIDFFEGRNFSQGAGAFGIGALVSGANPDLPPGPEPEEDRAYKAGLVKVPGTGAVAVRYDDNDTYQAARQSQGFASTFGAGLLYDKSGNDTYRAGGHYLHRPLRPNDFQSLSQGFSIGFRPRAGGGVGLLIDEEGNDFYNAEIYAQGVSYWYSVGLLYDRAGNDRYHATQYAQGAGVHLSVGSLWDSGGDDQYVSQFGVTQGTAHDLSVGLLLDESGDDYYLVDGGQGMSITNSVALFIDAQGNDIYATSGLGQGTLTWDRGFCGAGIFLDLEGKDTYPEKGAGKDGAVWSHDLYAIGIDLDRDVRLPDEVIPEPVLTASDSARTVEELFKEASIWEVGSAREKVRRARKALITKGVAAVGYVADTKLDSEDGLEYRAMLELGQAYPDTFAARILPHLFDARLQVQRNVIALLGELKRKEARRPLVEMLSMRKQEKHWTRVIQALGRIGDAAAAASLRPFLGDSVERRRINACVALSSLRDTASVPAIAGLLGDPLLTVRSAASTALNGFGTAAVGPLVERLSGQANHRCLTIQTLGKISLAVKDGSSPDSLRARSAARRALMAELERPAVDALSSARAAAVAVLLKLGDPEMRDFVRRQMLDEYDPLVLRTYEKTLKDFDK